MDEKSEEKGNIKVVCRFRPLNSKELNISRDMCVTFKDDTEIVIKSTVENNKYDFKFDKIFNTESTQEDVYTYTAKPLVDSVFEGFNGTIFAYGQTSSGKTHTMQGIIDSEEKKGVVPRMVEYLFEKIGSSEEDIEFTVKCSILEIYMEKIRDLLDLSRNNLAVREDKNKAVYVEDLSEQYCASDEEVLDLIKLGSDNRAVGATNMNEHSSRSHSIVILTIHQQNTKDLTAKIGKLYLVDLAGSEKISKTGYFFKKRARHDP